VVVVVVVAVTATANAHTRARGDSRQTPADRHQTLARHLPTGCGSVRLTVRVPALQRELRSSWISGCGCREFGARLSGAIRDQLLSTATELEPRSFVIKEPLVQLGRSTWSPTCSTVLSLRTIVVAEPDGSTLLVDPTGGIAPRDGGDCSPRRGGLLPGERGLLPGPALERSAITPFPERLRRECTCKPSRG